MKNQNSQQQTVACNDKVHQLGLENSLIQCSLFELKQEMHKRFYERFPYSPDSISNAEMTATSYMYEIELMLEQAGAEIHEEVQTAQATGKAEGVNDRINKIYEDAANPTYEFISMLINK